MIGIYKITNPKGLVYIGQSIDIEKRFYSYRILNCKDQSAIYNSLKKYGSENHLFEIIHECNKEELDCLEIMYIEKYNSYKLGLNSRSGGAPKSIKKSNFNNSNNSITIVNTYELKWTLSFAPEYQFTKCGKCINVKRGKEVRKILNGYSVGFCIKGKFYTLEKLRKSLTKIEDKICPF